MSFCSVQIPLWTIVTWLLDNTDFETLSSDSSMDDCNSASYISGAAAISVQIPLWTIVTRPVCRANVTFTVVQIPLWTIVTRRRSGAPVAV